MNSPWIKVLLSSLWVGAIATCALPQVSLADDSAPAVQATIVLPDGTECYWAGLGATLAFEGKRLNYTCGDTLGLIGDITIANGTSITLETATIDGTTITGSTPQTLNITSVMLTDGTTCTSAAADGLSRAIQDKPLDYFCNNSDTAAGLTGAITATNGVLSVDRITQEGFDRGYGETMTISTLTTAQP